MSPTPKTIGRIGFLKNPETLDALLDEFEKCGMPMGNERWAEHCRLRLKELLASERAFRAMKELLETMERNVSNDFAKHYRDQRKQITKEFQEKKRREELGPDPA